MKFIFSVIFILLVSSSTKSQDTLGFYNLKIHKDNVEAFLTLLDNTTGRHDHVKIFFEDFIKQINEQTQQAKRKADSIRQKTDTTGRVSPPDNRNISDPKLEGSQESSGTIKNTPEKVKPRKPKTKTKK